MRNSNNLSLILIEAARNGDLGEIERLAQSGANLKFLAPDGSTPMMVAAANGKIEAIEALAGLGADVKTSDQRGNTPLHSAAANGRLEAILVLKKLGADVNAADADGETAISDAESLLTMLTTDKQLAATAPQLISELTAKVVKKAARSSICQSSSSWDSQKRC